MASLAAQIIDQRINRYRRKTARCLRRGTGAGRRAQRQRSAAFTFLVARTVLLDLTNGDLTDDDVLDGIVDGSNDFGVDALYFFRRARRRRDPHRPHPEQVPQKSPTAPPLFRRTASPG